MQRRKSKKIDNATLSATGTGGTPFQIFLKAVIEDSEKAKLSGLMTEEGNEF